MPVLVRNHEAGPTVLVADEIKIEWGGANDPSGSDVQYVPDALKDSANFMRCIQRGILSIEGVESGQAALEQQNESYREKKEADKQSATDPLVAEANNDLVQAPCIGPSNRGQGECGDPVPVRDKNKDEALVLCPRHASLAPQYAQVETSEMKDTGDSLVPVKKWVRTQVTPRERQQQ